MPLPPGTRLAERFTIEQVLGSGGFGVTYSAWDESRRCRVAIKENYPAYLVQRGDDGAVILRGDEAAFRWAMRHFAQESNLLISLRHPNIVQGYSTLEENNTIYFVMEYLEGVSLTRFRQPGSWKESELKKLLTSLLEALHYLQQRNVCHRDIKPDNIIIKKNGDPILIDFGAAKQEASNASYSCSFMSSGYTAPEQIADYNCISPAIDIYALGATFYYLLTGNIPPPAPSRQLNPNRDTYVPLSSLPELTERYSSYLLESVDLALELHQDNRIPTAQAWLDILKCKQAPKKSQSACQQAAAGSYSKAAVELPTPKVSSSQSSYDDDDDDIIPLPTIAYWLGNVLLTLGMGALILVVISIFGSFGSTQVIDACLTFAMMLLIIGAGVRIALRFSNFD